MKRRYIFVAILLIVLCVALTLLYFFYYLPNKKYKGSDFGIKTYTSSHDQDGDGIDDQTDILSSAKAYIKTKPKYESKYYGAGYPDDEYGVCTDVVGFALLGAGYNLMNLVQEDLAAHPDGYDISKPDIHIDFRRVKNLQVYFANTAISLTTDIRQIEEWQGGDIVIWEKHIGIVSDHRNMDGIPYIIHHANPRQTSYEEDILETWGTIVGHYRIS